MGAETFGDFWMVGGSILIFIYTPVISISSASKPSTTNRPILLAIINLSPTVADWCRICCYFVYFFGGRVR